MDAADNYNVTYLLLDDVTEDVPGVKRDSIVAVLDELNTDVHDEHEHGSNTLTAFATDSHSAV
ncbi:hypothetical protein C8Q75DRAFT_803726 [Abortiporus biennis]|nr:hypothetical protein C8Q75DRAFT_803726 [Abortiporus biennis]